jgi:hypothetical protein
MSNSLGKKNIAVFLTYQKVDDVNSSNSRKNTTNSSGIPVAKHCFSNTIPNVHDRIVISTNVYIDRESIQLEKPKAAGMSEESFSMSLKDLILATCHIIQEYT